jgi:Tfp pilus assembly protein PilO
MGVAIGLGLGIAAAALGYQLQIKPMLQERDRNNAQIVELQGKITRGLAAKAKLPQFREEVALLEVQLEKLLKILPPRRDVQDVLRRFRALAEQEDFVLSEFRPGVEAQKDFYNEWPITVRLRGTYHNLARFFDRMSRFSRIFNVDNLQITQSRGRDQQTIQASFTAKTFVYQEPEPAPAAPAGQAGKGAADKKGGAK